MVGKINGYRHLLVRAERERRLSCVNGGVKAER